MCTCIKLKEGEYSLRFYVVSVVGFKKCDDSRSMDFVLHLVVGLLIISADLVHRLKSWKTVSPGNTV